MTDTLHLVLTGCSPSEAYWKISASIGEREKEASGMGRPIDLAKITPYDPSVAYVWLPPRFRNLKVSPWMFDHLRIAMHQACFPGGLMFVDYMDGIGPRPQVAGIVADPDKTLPRDVVILSP